MRSIGGRSIRLLSVPLKAYKRQKVASSDRFRKEYTYNTEAVNFQGSFHPMAGRKIQLKPRDQWSLEWYTVKTINTKLGLDVKDRIEHNGTMYLIQELTNWSAYGFVSYDVINDLKDS